jgi:predicted RNA-binding Zn ribbon-like protein
MRLIGGDSTLDFVNTVTGRVSDPAGGSVVSDDKLVRYEDLLDWARHAELLTAAQTRALARLAKRRPQEAVRVLSRAISARETLYRVLMALMRGRRPAPRDLAALNAEIAAARSRERLVPGATALEWAAAEPGARLDSVLWPVWRAAEALLTSPEISRLRECGGDGCGWLFVDRSRNRSRRWCTMDDCGNVSKVRRFRERRRREG